MAYLGFGVLLAVAAAISAFVATGSIALAGLAYAGAGVSVFVAALFAGWVSLRLEDNRNRPVWS